MKLLRDEEWSQWSDNEIARQCAVSQRFVSSLRPSKKRSKTPGGKGKRTKPRAEPFFIEGKKGKLGKPHRDRCLHALNNLASWAYG